MQSPKSPFKKEGLKNNFPHVVSVDMPNASNRGFEKGSLEISSGKDNTVLGLRPYGD
jgi:hypothetical protein